MSINLSKKYLLTLFFSCCLISPGAFAEEVSEEASKQNRIAKEIYAEIYSPFCPGRLLQDCPSTSATELKQEILSAVQSGQSKDQIMNNLLTKYGKELGALPKMQGFSILAWIIPVTFLIIGAAIIALWLKANQPKAAELQDESDHKDQDQDH